VFERVEHQGIYLDPREKYRKVKKITNEELHKYCILSLILLRLLNQRGCNRWHTCETDTWTYM
jgi:hypothetical protein